RRRYDSAYFYVKDYIRVKQIVDNTEQTLQVQNISFNETLEQERLEQGKREARQQYQSRIRIYALLGGLLFLAVLATVLYRNNKQRQKAHKEIDKAYKDLQATQAQLIQSEKMASLGELTAGIAHEIQNPLNFVNNFSEVNRELLVELDQEI